MLCQKEILKMTFDKWFEKQSRLVKVILLLIPVVGWICEILVRVSAVLRKPSTVNLLGLVLFIFFGWVLQFVDLVVEILTSKLFLLE